MPALRVRKGGNPLSKPVSHKLDIYGDTLHLVTSKRAVSTLKRRFGAAFATADVLDGIGTTTTLRHSKTGDCHIIVWLDLDRINNTGSPGRELVDAIAHEASHAADYIAGRGIDDHARAYLVGWISGWLWDNVQAET